MSDYKPDFVPDGYSLMHLLGSGQTSYVYLATHPRFGDIALKLPRPELQHRPVLWRMFENEVQITLSLNAGSWRSDNVITALDGFPTGDKAFLVLEYCAGGTLDELLATRELIELDDAFQFILEVARGLEFCHKQQVLHRDVKPANVLLTANRQARLADFGTGMFMAERTTERVGTAFYMAPEIFEGKGPSIQSDIYSLGVLAYEVLSGTRPFTGNSYDELMLQHLTSVPVSLKYKRSNISTDVSQVIAQAMSRDQSKRFINARDFIATFERVIGIEHEDAEMKTGRTSRSSGKPETSKSKAVSPKPSEPKEKRGLFGWMKGKNR